MSRQTGLVTTCLLCIVVSGCEHGHRIGQSTNVQFGRVRSAEPVSLDSNAAKGALIGGTIGLAAGRSDSAAFNAIRGATVGGAATAIAEGGNREGIAYTVEMSNGSTTRVVTDQREIREGDCVAVERSGNTANIRRTSDTYCDPANGQALREVERTVQSQAADCQRAKEDLAKARGDEAIELAIRKTELLCDG
jgi:outer membrane lipoprotein SlyB